MISEKRTRPNFDNFIVVVRFTFGMFPSTSMIRVILPAREKPRVGRQFTSSSIDGRTTADVPPSGISTRTGICFCSRAVCISSS